MNVLIIQFITDHKGQINHSFLSILYTKEWSYLMSIKLDKDIDCFLLFYWTFYLHYCSWDNTILVFCRIFYRDISKVSNLSLIIKYAIYNVIVCLGTMNILPLYAA